MLVPSDAKTVVFMPTPYTSHTKYHTSVARAVAKLGHQVWVTMPTYLLEKGYLDVSGFNTIPYETVPDLEASTLEVLGPKYFKGGQEDFFAFLGIAREIVEMALKNETFLKAIQQTRPDLIVIDNLAFYYTMSIIPYRLGVPFAFLGSMYYPPRMGIPFSPAETPSFLLPYTNRMTFVQRLVNILLYLTFAVYDPSAIKDAVSKYAPEKPSLSVDTLVQTKTEIWLVESDHILDYPKPTLPNIKLIGGAAAGPAKRLPPEFQSFMDGAPQGVVIVSFGSYVIDLPKHISDKILQVLLQLPMKSIFRCRLPSPDPEKILTSEWIPQNDLLGHVNTKVFVSHCGKNGQYEALYHAVPIVATPFFTDQAYNAERARTKGFAEIVDLKSCTADQLQSTIKTVATEPSYKENVSKLSRLFKQQYGVPMETAAFWIDHVMEYGGGYMRSAGQEMPFYQYILMDVILFIVLVVAISVGLIYVLVRAVFRLFYRNKVKGDWVLKWVRRPPRLIKGRHSSEKSIKTNINIEWTSWSQLTCSTTPCE